mmetsp:Transcript_12283/g.17884  ORF Transcript_12283/g.17884 Transcript_12283/m.17884 type:complete len:235 (-) Transcript_12283:117-821(-)
METKERNKLLLILLILNDSNLQVLTKVIPEHDILAMVLILSNITEHVKRLAYKALINDTQHLGLLENLATDIQGKIIRIHNSLNELEPTGHDILKLIIDENTLDVESDIACILVEHIFAQLKGEHSRNVEESLTLHLSLKSEVCPLLRFIVTRTEGRFVEFLIFLFLHLLRWTEPYRLLRIHGCVFLLCDWYSLHLGFFPLGQIGIGFNIGHLLIIGRFLPETEWKLDEFTVSL